MKTHQTLLLGIVTFALSSNVSATNGYFSHGYGAKSKSMAGTCVAMTFDSACAVTNPASLVMMGNRLDYGLGWFWPIRGFNAHDNASPVGPPNGPASIPPGGYESVNDWFLLPNWSYSRMLGERNAFGIFLEGNGGMNTRYESAVFRNFSNPMDPSTQAFSPTGIDLMQGFIGVSYSRKLSEQQALGITPLFAIQTLEIEGLQPFKPFSIHPENVTDNGHDYSFGGGVRIGWIGQLSDSLTLGASYQSKLWMTPFEEYKGLLAEKGNFDIPANYNVGFAIKMTPKLTLAFDYQFIEYSGVNAMSNASDIAFVPGQKLLGTDDGLGFGWDDMDIFKFGVEWKYSPDFTLRAGYSYANTPFPNTQALFNTLAPAVVRKHYTLGFSTPISDLVEFNVAFMYAPNEEVHGSNINTGPQTGFVEMEQLEIELGWGIRF